jgi:hypothetical protein
MQQHQRKYRCTVYDGPKCSTSIILGRIYIEKLHLYHLKLHIIHHTVKHIQVANILSKLQNGTEVCLINYTMKRTLENSNSNLTILTNNRIVHFKSSCVSCRNFDISISNYLSALITKETIPTNT